MLQNLLAANIYLFLYYNLYIQEALNFTYSLTVPPDGEWGSERPDGSWSGMIGELNNKNTDIGKYTIHFVKIILTDFTFAIKKKQD